MTDGFALAFPSDRWPAGHRGALCVSIDVDGGYGELNYQPPANWYDISQTDYDPTGVDRLLQLLAVIDVRGTFCWVGRAAEDEPDLVRRAVAEGHELALHSWDHRGYRSMSPTEQRDDLLRAAATLIEVSGQIPVGHKTASWNYDDATHALAQEVGLDWVMDRPLGDLPSLLQPDSALSPLVDLPPSKHYDDYFYFVDKTVTPRATFEFWREALDVLRAEGGLMCLTLHSFVSGRPGPSRALARLLDYAIDLGDIWIARADEIARSWRSRSGGALPLNRLPSTRES